MLVEVRIQADDEGDWIGDKVQVVLLDTDIAKREYYGKKRIRVMTVINPLLVLQLDMQRTDKVFRFDLWNAVMFHNIARWLI